MMKRRIFLAALIGTAGALAWRFRRGNNENAIVAIVYKRLGYLRLDDDGVHRFADDFAARHILNDRGLRTIGALWPVYRYIPCNWHNPLNDRVNFAEDRIVSKYLISTDFFTNGADATRPVNYLGFYDAMLGCGNPFRRSVEDGLVYESGIR